MKISIERAGPAWLLQALVPHGPDAARIASAVLCSDGVLWMYSPEGGYWSEDNTDAGYALTYRVSGVFACNGALHWARRLPRDIAFRLEFDKRALAGDKQEIRRDNLTPYPAEYACDGQSVGGIEALESAMADPDAPHALGKFVLSATALRVSDPCYRKTSRNAGVLQALPGNWHSDVVVGDSEGSRCVKVLRVWHNSLSADTFEDKGIFAPVMTVGVDGGHCGFFDDAFYPDGDPTVSAGADKQDNAARVVRRPEEIEILDLDQLQVPAASATVVEPVSAGAERVVLDMGDDLDNEGQESTFYANCCRLTSDEHLPGGGVLSEGFGVISRSGYGDGGYVVKVLKNADGLVVAALIEYLVDDEENDEGAPGQGEGDD